MNNTIYIAGPYGRRQGLGLEALQHNVNEANFYAAKMLYKGWHIYVPHNNHYTHIVMGNPLTEDEWAYECLFWLSKCNAILLTCGWERSAGSKRELAEAIRLGLEVYRSIKSVPEIKEG